MRIVSMTATFGKLEHQTLTLEPGLNIIEAPNEWGKSTWCAFLLAMLYGIDTRERSTKTVLAQKERYDPWCGSPMSGSMTLVYQGKQITLERRTKGRIPMGQFRAFETQSGLELPWLTADNCGQQLLGVEKSVFTRSGFIRQAELPVSEDQALWRRLNALVTTGDDSGQADAISQQLRDLKNKIRSNRANGLIPQVLAQKEALESKLRELQQLEQAIGQGKAREEALAAHQAALAEHQAHLAYRAAQENAARVEQANTAAAQAEAEAKRLEEKCAQLPSREEARSTLQGLKQLQEESLALQLEQQMLPPAPELPPETGVFAAMTREQMGHMLAADTAAYQKPGTGWLAVLGIGLTCICALLGLWLHPAAFFGLAATFAMTVWGLVGVNKRKQRKAALLEKYGNSDPAAWKKMADDHLAARETVEKSRKESKKVELDFYGRQRALAEKLPAEGLQKAMDSWQDVLSLHGALDEARYRARQAGHYAQTLAAMQALPPKPESTDSLSFTEAETARLLSDCQQELRQLHRQLGVCQGRMESLGQAAPLEEELQRVNTRLSKLEETYAAIELAQNTLEAARQQLRSRFAPRITQRAKELMSVMTGGRYDRLTLDGDLGLHAAAQGEDVQRESLRRSDGTVDQLYLALRLAVAGELTPETPLILDDALVRFDDTRLKAALEILQEESATRQILLFTCQSRENALLCES